MEPISKIKKEMEFNQNLGSLLKVIKTIAAMEFHAFKKKMGSFERFLQVLEHSFEMVQGRKVMHPFISNNIDSIGVVAITSDAGLLGGLNAQVIRSAIVEYKKQPGKMIVVGTKGQGAAQEAKIPIVAFPGIKEDSRYEQALQLRDYVCEEVLKGGFGRLKIVYPFAESVTVQKVKIQEILPFEKFKEISSKQKIADKEIIIESAVENIVEYLIYLWIGHNIFEILSWSRLAELAARYTHLESSSQKLEEVEKKIKMKYHKVRHQLVDRSMSEIFSARTIFSK
ncbi:MAG: F0F1 ATP synthase subunit gamma [Candidatus Omnitrophica bacterium]|nr:F0F1 ATP synthase subunit gamma [Candidatus Omnitrophota bacterium]